MMSALHRLWFELRTDVLSAKAVPALSSGFTSGLILLVAQVAFGSFIFSGDLAPYSSQGVGLILFGNCFGCLLMALAGGYRGAIAGLTPALVIVMAMIAGSVDAHGEALFVTVAFALVASAVATGVCCFVIGKFQLANLVRFVPYPVAAGFVSGIGGAVCLAALSMMGADPTLAGGSNIFEPAALWSWLPGTAYGIILFIAIKRWRNALTLPASVIVTVCAYHLALSILDISGDEARAMHLLLTSTADGGLWPVLFPSDLAHVEWAAFAGQIPNMLTLMLIAFICVIMNIAGLEIAVNQELDWNREFRAAGLASVGAGLGGGTVATLIVLSSMRSKLLKATTRLTGIVAAAVLGIALFVGDGLLDFVPMALIGGILISAGLAMLDEGLAKNRKLLHWTEFGIILVIFVVINLFGLLEGVAVGMLVTLAFFAVRLSRVDPIESRFSARERHSNKARSVPDRAILLEEGGRVLVYLLRGYIFFGSIGPLIDKLKKTLEGPSQPACIILDFASVSGSDYSAVSALSRFLRATSEAGVEVVLSAESEKLKSSLEDNLPASVFARLSHKPNLDHALEYCEEIVIAAWRTDETATESRRTALFEHSVDEFERHLERQIQFEDLVGELREWLSPRNYSAGEVLMEPKSEIAGLELLLSGRASSYDDEGLRLHQFGPGDAILPETASGRRAVSVVADESCRTQVLTPSALRWLEKNRQEIALRLYRYLLAEQFMDKRTYGQGVSTGGPNM